MSSVKILVPVSGGKDSQACLKLAIEQYGAPAVRGLFCDTGWEHPLTYQHVSNLRQWYSVQIDTVSAGSVESEVLKYKRFPTNFTRFCTSHLKIRPSRRYYKALAEKQDAGFEVWYGMRSGESSDREKRYAGKIADEVYPPHEVNPEYPKYLNKMAVSFRLPVLHWSTTDVLAYLDGMENPLYQMGSDRVGCFPCLASGKLAIRNAFNADDFGRQQQKKVIWLEQQIGKKHERAETDQLCLFCHV
jgi:3'-phosphoadenosine 5'-phosphosulfate sulfotransferase (PAPS reductase)/FAD synthetase